MEGFLSADGKFAFQKPIGLALWLEVHFTIFCFVFTLYLRGNSPSTSPRGAYIWRGRFNGGSFLRYRVLGGLIFGGALYMEGAYFWEFLHGLIFTWV